MKRDYFITGKISIIIPVYNNAGLLIDMVKSIQENTYTNWELILVDDISCELEFQKIKDYCLQDERIHIFQRDRFPKGAQTCRNIGLQKVTGEYVCFFDADDIISKECLKNRVEFIQAKADIDFAVFPSGLLVDGQIIDNPNRLAFGYSIYKRDLDSFLSRELPFIVWSNIYRAQSLKKYALEWDENLLSWQDGDFNIQSLLKHMQYNYADTRPDYFYRIDTTNSISKKIPTNEHFLSHLYYLDKCYTTVQKIYGSTCNAALFNGVLFLYNIAFEKNIDSHLAQKLIEVTQNYDRKRGLLLQFANNAILFLSSIVGTHNARRFIMSPYIIGFIYRKKRKQKLIKSKQKKH